MYFCFLVFLLIIMTVHCVGPDTFLVRNFLAHLYIDYSSVYCLVLFLYVSRLSAKSKDMSVKLLVLIRHQDICHFAAAFMWLNSFL